MSGFDGGGPRTRDGKEVVAVCGYRSNSRTKRFSFEFLGSGASGLGSRWSLMAVMSGLVVFDRERGQHLVD